MEKQRYSFADVFICWSDDDPDTPPQRRLIALKSRERLLADEQTYLQATAKGSQPANWSEGGEYDNEIFYYCNGYEEFLTLITYGYNTQDFRVLGIVRLIE